MVCVTVRQSRSLIISTPIVHVQLGSHVSCSYTLRILGRHFELAHHYMYMSSTTNYLLVYILVTIIKMNWITKISKAAEL